MLKKLSSFIVNKRLLILAIMLVLTVVSVVCSGFVGINEDMTKYLPDDSSMKAGMDIMNGTFPEMETANGIRVMFDDLTESEKTVILEKLKTVQHVDSVDYDPVSEEYNKDNHTLFLLNISCEYGSVEEEQIEAALETEFSEYTMIWQNNDPQAVGIPVVVFVAVMIILLAILFTMCGSWAEPFLFLVTIGIAVLINAGTNIFLGEIAAVTNSIAALLQMALSMDYSIIMMNRYRQEKKQEPDKIQAMKNAWAKAFASISASSLTTVVGLLMLTFMSFKIGADLGIVLAKGVFTSMICVLTILPALILICDKLLVKTAKKEPHIAMKWAAKFSHKARYVMCGVFLALFAGFYVLQSNTVITYSLVKKDAIADVFPKNNAVVVVYDNDDEAKLGELLIKLENDKNVTSVMGYGTVLGKPFTADQLAGVISGMSADLKFDSSMLGMIYYHHYNNGNVGKLTLGEMLTFISETVANSDSLSDYIDEDMMEKMGLIGIVSNKNEIQKQRTPAELASMLGIDESMANTVFILHNSQDVSGKTMSLKDFISFLNGTLMDDPAFSASFDEQTKAQLAGMDQIVTVSVNNTKLTASAISAITGMPIEQTEQIIYSQNTDTMTLPAFINTAVSFSPDNTQLLQLQQLVQLAASQTPLDANTLSMTFGMDENTVKTVFRLYFGGNIESKTLSLQETVNFILSDTVMKSYIESNTVSQLQKVQFLINTVIKEVEFPPQQMSGIFSQITDGIDAATMEVIYLYAESVKNADPTWTMTLESLFNHLVDKVINDPRFDLFINEEMKTTLLEYKTTLEDGKKQLVSDEYSRLVINTTYPKESEETTAFVKSLEEYTKTNMSEKSYLIGDSAMTYEMQHIFDTELTLITLLTALAIFLIVMLTFRSISIPLILVLLVQCGVYITVTVTGIITGDIYYLALLIVECILMGATIDYGILFTNYYSESRRTLNAKDALIKAYEGSMHTIMTSGTILVTVTALVGGLFGDETVEAIVRTISVGSFSALLLILFVLPGILAACDKFVIKKKNRAENSDTKTE